MSIFTELASLALSDSLGDLNLVQCVQPDPSNGAGVYICTLQPSLRPHQRMLLNNQLAQWAEAIRLQVGGQVHLGASNNMVVACHVEQ